MVPDNLGFRRKIKTALRQEQFADMHFLGRSGGEVSKCFFSSYEQHHAYFRIIRFLAPILSLTITITPPPPPPPPPLPTHPSKKILGSYTRNY
jgi:hypothetical protein